MLHLDGDGGRIGGELRDDLVQVLFRQLQPFVRIVAGLQQPRDPLGAPLLRPGAFALFLGECEWGGRVQSDRGLTLRLILAHFGHS